jgi:hypothetical protein
MKKLSLLLLLLISTASFSQTQLKSFDELMTALKAGKNVKAVIYYAKCKLFSDGVEETEVPNAIGGMSFTTYEYFDTSVFKGKRPSFVTTSETVLINHRFYGYVNNYVKLRVNIDNSIEITAQYLKNRKFSAKYKVVMDETFKGAINDGSNDGGIYLYAE